MICLLYGISIIPYNWGFLRGCRHPLKGVTAEKCDQILHFVQDHPDPEE